MKTFFLLITLTQNGAGDINASFVNTETLEQCQQKALMVEAVFTASDIPVVESRCIKSGLQFTEFGHASTASDIWNFYLIAFDENTLNISAMPDWFACMEKKKDVQNVTQQAVQQGHVYCSSSVQSLR